MPGTYPDNIHILGPLSYAEVPAALSFCDIAMVPFKDCELVRGVSPIKIYEYLAAGLPTVSLRWDELARQSMPIRMATTCDEFLRALDQCRQATNLEREGFRDFARRNSWEQRLRSILGAVGMSLEEP